MAAARREALRRRLASGPSRAARARAPAHRLPVAAPWRGAGPTCTGSSSRSSREGGAVGVLALAWRRRDAGAGAEGVESAAPVRGRGGRRARSASSVGTRRSASAGAELDDDDRARASWSPSRPLRAGHVTMGEQRDRRDAGAERAVARHRPSSTRCAAADAERLAAAVTSLPASASRSRERGPSAWASRRPISSAAWPRRRRAHAAAPGGDPRRSSSCSRTTFDPEALQRARRRARGARWGRRASGTTRSAPRRSRPSTRAPSRRLEEFRALEPDVDDLDGLAELADGGPGDRRRARRAARRRSRTGWPRSRRSACSPAATTPATRS